MGKGERESERKCEKERKKEKQRERGKDISTKGKTRQFVSNVRFVLDMYEYVVIRYVRPNGVCTCAGMCMYETCRTI